LRWGLTFIFAWGWPTIVILPISAFQVARIWHESSAPGIGPAFNKR
jgi:hypothetical protein